MNAAIGYSYRSRHGIRKDDEFVVDNHSGGSLLVGAGLHHLIGKHFLTGLMAQYSFSTDKMPYSFYVGGMAAYYFNSAASQPGDTDAEESVFFPKQELALSLYNRDVVNVEYPRRIPFFWAGGVKLQHGFSLSYRRAFYHSQRHFSLEWGANAQSMTSQKNNTDLYALSLFSSLRYWFLRTTNTDAYFSYTLAGPTYISRNQVDDKATGKHFTFFDAITLGVIYQHHLDLGLEMAHYSNGNLFPENPGFCIPLSLRIGYVF